MKYLIAIRHKNEKTDVINLFRVSDRDQYQISEINYDNTDDCYRQSTFTWIRKLPAIEILNHAFYIRCFHTQASALIHIGKLIGMCEIHV